MADLLDGKYDDVVNKYIIVDSRYPYEYDGGHIQVRPVVISYCLHMRMHILYERCSLLSVDTNLVYRSSLE